MADMFAEALSKLPQKVIWKLRGKVPQKVPDNVKLMDVIPQNDLLGKCPLKNKNGTTPYLYAILLFRMD